MFRPYLLICFLVSVGITSTASSNEPPPPPTTPTSAIAIGIFGLIAPGTTLFHSYDTGTQLVGTAFYPTIWYSFSVGSGEAQAIQLNSSFRTGSDYGASYTLYDGNLTPLGRFDAEQVLKSGSYYIQVMANSPTKFHFGFVGIPAKRDFKNDAGRSEDKALSLGKLPKATTHTNDFYTFYKRLDVALTDLPTPGTMVPDFQSPNPAIQTEFYSFELGNSTSLKVLSISRDDDTYIISQPATATTVVLKDGQSVQLAAGIYGLEIVDRLTQVSGGGAGTVVLTRDPHAENYEHHTFELLLEDVAPAPPGANPGPPEVSSFGPPPHGPCVQIGSQRIGAC